MSEERRARLLSAEHQTRQVIQRATLTFVGACVFVLITASFPDSYLLTTGTTVQLPLIGGTSFRTFIAIVPLVLIGIQVYLEVYVQHFRRLRRLSNRFSRYRPPLLDESANIILHHAHFAIRHLFLPLTLLVIFWKASALATLRLALFTILLLYLFGYFALLMPPRTTHTVPIHRVALSWLVATMILANDLLSDLLDLARRPLNLELANLERATLDGLDLRGANLRRAILDGASLRDADLSGADLSGASIERADLFSADLTAVTAVGADFGGANMRDVKFTAGNFRRAIFDRTNLVTRHDWFGEAIFQDVSMKSVKFQRQFGTTDAYIELLQQQYNVFICNIVTGEANAPIAVPGRCTFRWADNGHSYKYLSDFHSRSEAISSAQSAPTPAGACGQGYLVTITSAAEQAMVDRFFSPVESEGVWIGASDWKEYGTKEGRWIWTDGPEAGQVFWAQDGVADPPAPRPYSNWAAGEPNNDGGRENFAVSSWGWNDVTEHSSVPVVIEFDACR